MRLIDADAILRKNCRAPAKGKCNECDWEGDSHCSCEIFGVQLANAPTIEAKPVVYGRWEGAGMGDYYCSLCSEEISGNYHNFCPNCGADMREREET